MCEFIPVKGCYIAEILNDFSARQNKFSEMSVWLENVLFAVKNEYFQSDDVYISQSLLVK